MKVTNIHQRIINQPKENISKILDSLSSNNDRLWPKEKWPPMVFKKGLVEGATGGHRPIRYLIKKYIPGSLIEFNFMKPDGFKEILNRLGAGWIGFSFKTTFVPVYPVSCWPL